MCLLKEITVYSEAISAYNEELAYSHMLGSQQNSVLMKKQSKGGLAFCAYLKMYLALPGFWLSWLKAGAIDAASHLGVAVKNVVRTTNHLESFNG